MRRVIRKLFGLFLIVAVLSGPAVAIAKEPRVYRVGLILLVSSDRPHVRGLRDGLKEAGYIEGKNLRLDMLKMRSPDELPATVKTEIEMYDAIVTTGNNVTRLAKETTQTVPIVFMPSSAPVRAGFVKSLARPGTNLTGLTYEPIQLGSYGKRLEIFKEALPSLQRLALLYDNSQRNIPRDLILVEVRRVAHRLGVNLAEYPVTSHAHGEQVVALLSKETTDGLAIICSAVIYGSKEFATFARQKGIAYLGCSPSQVTGWGALISYAPDMYRIGHRAAWYVDQILRGAKPHNLPVEGPRKYELAINLKTAKEIGVDIPSELLIRADKVVK